MPAPEVSVVVPVYGQSRELERCLTALRDQSVDDSVFEVIVVDNHEAPTVNLKAVRGPVIRVVHQGRQGSYAARNLGIQVSRGNIVAFTDSDCTPDGSWIGVGLSKFRRSDGPSRLAGAVRLELPPRDACTPAALYESVFAFPQEYYARLGTSVTANMWTRRAVFESVGLFDESAFSGEDVAWGKRAAIAGERIEYVPGLVVYHPPRNSLDELIAKARRTYGGHYATQGWARKGLIVRTLLGAFALRPPVRQIPKVLAAPLSTREKLIVFWVLMQVRFAQWVEHMRLVFGRGPERA
jgi:glycosyltransferase involved in cell wall biosynthesis